MLTAQYSPLLHPLHCSLLNKCATQVDPYILPSERGKCHEGEYARFGPNLQKTYARPYRSMRYLRCGISYHDNSNDINTPHNIILIYIYIYIYIYTGAMVTRPVWPCLHFFLVDAAVARKFSPLTRALSWLPSVVLRLSPDHVHTATPAKSCFSSIRSCHISGSSYLGAYAFAF